MKSRDNFATEGLSGTYKQVVFRQLFGKTILGKRPKRTKASTASQNAITTAFKEAAMYAKSILIDPLIKAAYKLKAKPGQSAFNVAVADYFKKPVMGEIDSAGYNGQVGSTLMAKVTDDFKIVSVRVRIEKSNGSLLEEGDASLLPDGLNWMYVSTVVNGNVSGTKINFTATDLPNHSTVQTKIL